jgi:flagellar motor switch protein FliN/FliY
MTTDQSAGSPYRPFAEAFFHALVEAITQATGSSWLAAAVADAQSPDEAEPFHLAMALSGEMQGEILLSLRSSDAVLLAAKCLQQPAGEFTEEHTQALLRLMETAAAQFSSAAQDKYGAFTAVVSSTATPPPENAALVEFTAGDDAGNRVTLLMHLQPELIASLETRARLQEADGVEERVIMTPGQLPPEQMNLQLVLDVELNVTLRFGQRQLALREVLELASGSVIELDRQVEEPVELLLEGRVIARGEAVVVDGNYGLRVTEVPQPVAVPVLR